MFLVQLLSFFYWNEKKGGYFIDELFTIEYTCSYNDSEAYNQYVYQTDGFKEGEWLDLHQLKERFRFDENKSLMKRPLLDNLTVLFSRNPYFAILNVASTVFLNTMDIKQCSFWINCILFFLTESILVFMIYRITRSPLSLVAALILFGFSGIAISLVIYIRFYVLVALLTALIYLLNYMIFVERCLLKQLLYEGLLGIILLIGMKTLQLEAVFFAVFYVALTITMICKKEYKRALIYALPITLCGLIYAYKTGLMQIVIRGNESPNWHAAEMAGAFTDFSIIEVKESIMYWIDLLWHQVFGARISMLLTIILVVVFAATVLIKHPHVGVNGIYMIPTIITIILYGAFIVITGIAWRYIIFAFVGVPIVIAYIISVLSRFLAQQDKVFAYITALIYITVFSYGAHKTYNKTLIDFVYEADKGALEKIRDEYSNYDVVVLHQSELNGYGHLYEAIYNSSEGSRIKYVTESTYTDLGGETNERFLLWLHRGEEVLCEPQLKDAGYSIEYLSGTHISDIYVCERER